jgi:Glycosyl transferases group 1
MHRLRVKFEGDREAVFFSSVDQWADKRRFYLDRPTLRETIVRHGRERASARATTTTLSSPASSTISTEAFKAPPRKDDPPPHQYRPTIHRISLTRLHDLLWRVSSSRTRPYTRR